jgi:hypothetical protein
MLRIIITAKRLRLQAKDALLRWRRNGIFLSMNSGRVNDEE